MLTYGIGPELAQIANGMAKLGWKVPIIGSWTLSMANYIDNSGANGEGARMPQTFIQDPDTPKRKAFIDAYLAKFKPKNNRIDSPVSAARAMTRSSCWPRPSSEPTPPTARRSAKLENLQTPVEGVVMTYNKPFSRQPRRDHGQGSGDRRGQGGRVVKAN